MDILMTTEEIIRSAKSSFAMENMKFTKEDEIRGREILSGTKSIDDIIQQLQKKYSISKSV